LLMDAPADFLTTSRPGDLGPETSLWLFNQCGGEAKETTDALVELCRLHSGAEREFAMALLAKCESWDLMDNPVFQATFQAQRALLEKTDLGLFLSAQCSERWGDPAEAARSYQLLDREGVPSKDSVLLDLVRVLATGGRYEEACETLRRAASCTRDFGYLSRAARQLLRLEKHARRVCARTVRIGLLYPYTTDLWVPLLRLGLFREGIWAEFQVPPYGTHHQAILDPGSPFFAFDPEVVILASTWRELNLPPFSEDPAKAAFERIEALVEHWKVIQARIPARIIQHNFEVPALDPNGHLGEAMAEGRASVVRKINDLLWLQSQTHHVTILNFDQIASTYGKRSWADAGAWFSAKQYPAPSALPALVEGQVARIRAGLGLTKKVLVLDLDNTLWGGVIGEDGLMGIQIGPPSATGEAHLALQRYVGQLKKRGILLAVCSKNNETDARAPFLEHEGMHLRLDDFVAFKANWLDKPSNLRAMAMDLNLGLDSFVFLDDSPTERAFVRRELPQVAVPDIGSDPVRYVEILDSKGYFDADSLSPEDLERSKTYLNNAQRQAMRTSAGSLDDFLKGLEMVCEHGPIDDHVLPRVLQLLGKTNQFNLTSRRHGEAQLRRILADPAAWTHFFRLKDKFDDNGLVGIVIAVPSIDHPSTWELDSWLMSCRVIGRQLENFMFNTLLEAAKSRGIATLHGLFSPTSKNSLVEHHYQALGFIEAEGEPDGRRRFVLSTAEGVSRPAAFILDPR